MTVQVQHILVDFERLTETEKKDVAAEILRRAASLHWAPLTDDELVSVADEAFARLDQDEASK